MQGRDFQDTAERLIQGTTEADWRSGVSRAYYAVFHHFRELFLVHGLNLGQSGLVHSSLHMGLQNSGFTAVEQLGRDVDALYRARRDADYELLVAVGYPVFQQDVQEASRIVADFTALLATIPIAQIVHGVRAYLRTIRRIP